VPLPQLRRAASDRPGDIPADVRILSGDPLPDGNEQLLHHWGGRYGLSLGQTGSGWVFRSCFGDAITVSQDGRRVGLTGDAAARSPGTYDVLERRVLPRVATLFGATALHGASVRKNGLGLLLLGSSGAGKSTLTAALAVNGWDVLSDDLSVVRGGDGPVLEPCGTGICVWPDTRAALNLDPRRCDAMPGYVGKLRYDAGQTHDVAPARLGGCIVLKRRPDIVRPRIEPIRQAEALIAAVRQYVPFNPAGSIEQHAEAVAAIHRIVAAAPAFRLSYPGNYAALDATREALEALAFRAAA
jgi:hypothetical protein